MDKGGLWKEILVSKYGGWRSLREGGKVSRGSLWWKDLKQVWDSEGWGRSFEDGFKWKVGNGKDISFWEDSLLSCGALKRVFPRLYSLSSAKEAKLDWRRSFFDWEKALLEQLVQNLQEVKPFVGEEDVWVWKVGGCLTYAVNSAYVHLRRVQGGQSSSVYSKLWRCKALPSALITAWRVLENRVASRVNLARRGVVWCLCFEWLGVSFVFHKDPLTNFSQFRMSQASESVNDVWSAIWVGIVSEIWKHRNSIIFNRGVIDVSEVFASMQVKLGSKSFGLYEAVSLILVRVGLGAGVLGW
ncbi:uncharacterized protein [Phaseolus vulgaris]|uniref:uncharacterized protein n=1 Tax=Phaseolus vulgaris TaxID=3885 RepID=UPI0035CB1DC9